MSPEVQAALDRLWKVVKWGYRHTGAEADLALVVQHIAELEAALHTQGCELSNKGIQIQELIRSISVHQAALTTLEVATIERCAQVADAEGWSEFVSAGMIAIAIRALSQHSTHPLETP